MPTSDGLDRVARSAATRAVAAAWPFVGLGDQIKLTLDEVAQGAIDRVLQGLPLSIVMNEGPRDGSPGSGVVVSTGHPAAYAYVDAIDGTTNAARGGARSFSGVCLDPSPPMSAALGFGDSLSVFIVGGFDSANILEAFRDVRSRISNKIASVSIGTLHRADNRAIVERRIPGTAAREGSRTGYLPTTRIGNVTLVGDASITLPWEFDMYFGRVGAAEAFLTCGLDVHARAIPVSRAIMMSIDDPSEYIESLCSAVSLRKRRAVADHYTDADRASIGCAGDLGELVINTTAEQWISDQASTCIASLTGTHDPGFDKASLAPRGLDPARHLSSYASYEIHCLERTAGQTSARVAWWPVSGVAAS